MSENVEGQLLITGERPKSSSDQSELENFFRNGEKRRRRRRENERLFMMKIDASDEEFY